MDEAARKKLHTFTVKLRKVRTGRLRKFHQKVFRGTPFAVPSIPSFWHRDYLEKRLVYFFILRNPYLPKGEARRRLNARLRAFLMEAKEDPEEIRLLLSQARPDPAKLDKHLSRLGIVPSKDLSPLAKREILREVVEKGKKKKNTLTIKDAILLAPNLNYKKFKEKFEGLCDCTHGSWKQARAVLIREGKIPKLATTLEEKVEWLERYLIAYWN